MTAITARGAFLGAWVLSACIATGFGAPLETNKVNASTPKAGHVAKPSDPLPPAFNLRKETPAENFYSMFIKERLSAGLRVTSFSLTDPDRPEDETREETFIGYVNELQEEDNNQIHPTILYKLHRYVAFEFTMDEISARTQNFNNHLADGVVVMSGPIFNLLLTYPLMNDRISPYVGLGYAPWTSSFDHDAWWMYGWGSPEEYEAAGSPGTSSNGYERRILVEDDSGMVWTVGVNAKLHRHAELDFMVRGINLEPVNEHGVMFDGMYAKKREGEFTLNHIAFGCALRVIF